MAPSKKALKKITDDYSIVKEFVRKIRQGRSRKNRKIVLTQGSFDMIHVGHARYCQEAKKYGNILILGVDSDEKIRHRKGPDRPIVPQEERLEMLTYLEPVSLVVLKKLKTPKWKLIKTIKPDVLVTTEKTYTSAQIKKLEKICGQVVVLEPMAVTSTSAKLRLVQLGTAKKIKSTLTNKLIKTIEDVLGELKGE